MNEIYIIILAAIIIVICLNRIYRKKRTHLLAQKVIAMGHNFTAKTFLPLRYRTLNFSGLKYGIFFAKAENIINEKSDHFELTVFEYGRSRKQAFFVLDFADMSFPVFNLYPNTTTNRLDMSFSKYRRLELKGDPAFNDQYLLYGEQQDQLEPFLSDNLKKALMGIDHFSFEGRENTLLFFKKGAGLNAKSVDKAIPLAKDIGQIFLNARAETPSLS